jgi:hypothetical protein
MLIMLCLSVKQPWAWLIVEGWKPVENRKWFGDYLKAQLAISKPPCWLLIHAGKGMTKAEYNEAVAFAGQCGVHCIPTPDRLRRGGVVGLVRFTGTTRFDESPFFTGPMALKFAAPYPMPFALCDGRLGFFDAGRIY